MSANTRKTGNLLALGSAAVVAVYGAGFMRTAEAAERFAQQSSEHVLSPAEAEVIAALANAAPNDPIVPPGVTSAGAQSSVSNDSGVPAVAANKVDATTANSAASGAVTESSVAAQPRIATQPAAVAPNTADTRAATDAKQTATTMAAVPSAAGVASSVTPPVAPQPAATNAAPPPPVATNVARATTTPPANTPAPVSAPVPPAPAPAKTEEAAPGAPKWKDGSYTGYGTSRHGDIEVYLETDGGKISFIKISACLTQYSCSWIGELPGQVIARQSPKVDAPSGATQSANAFYYAVVQALAKAK